MVSNRHITKIVSLVMAAAVLSCILAMAFPQKLAQTAGGTGVALAYGTGLFGHDSVIQVQIQMEEGQWEEMLENAMAEEYYSCDVEINGEKLRNVGIRPKGNTSLSAIAMDPETDRFSLKLEFDHYVEGQTCLGLDKLILNNNYADATNMKEAIVYDMYQYLGADASLYNYAEISVNGEYWGVYLALEAVEESFLLRNFGAEDGNLYKPEGLEMGAVGGGQPEGGGFQKGGFPGSPEAFQGGEPPESAEGFRREEPPGDGKAFLGSGFSMGSGGADLNYTDDDLDSYSAIWDGEVTDSGKKDHKRVVEALKNISQGTELETYLDIDNVLKYMAVHAFSVNMDSLSGNMAHNYYLYEYDGKLNILPWDYNLAFGGMGMGAGNEASAVVNAPIDDPFQGTAFFDALLEDGAYLEAYHGYLRELVEEYVLGGRFQEAYQRIRSQIDALVESDPTAFYAAPEYEAAAEMLYRTVMLRAQSILGQLEGAIPSTDAGQRADASALVDASSIHIEAMGTFDMGARQGGEPPEGMPEAPGEGFQPPDGSGESGAGIEAWFQLPEGMPGDSGAPDMPGEWSMPERGAAGQEAAQMPPAGRGPQEAFQDQNADVGLQNAAVYGGCLLTAAAALAAVWRYRRVPGKKRGSWSFKM